MTNFSALRGRVSVIVSVNKYVKTLSDTVSSIQACGYENLEVVVVNPNKDLQVTRAFAKLRAPVIEVTKSDKSLYEGFNNGLESATGDYIVFLNSDDWWSPNFIQFGLEMLEVSGADWVFGDTLRVSKSGESHMVMAKPDYFLILDRNFVNFFHTTVIIKSKVFQAVGPFETHYKFFGKKYRFKVASDYEWFRKADSRGYVGVLDSRISGNMRLGGVSDDHSFFRLAFFEGWIVAKKYATGKSKFLIDLIWLPRLFWTTNKLQIWAYVRLTRIRRKLRLLGAKVLGR